MVSLRWSLPHGCDAAIRSAAVNWSASNHQAFTSYSVTCRPAGGSHVTREAVETMPSTGGGSGGRSFASRSFTSAIHRPSGPRTVLVDFRRVVLPRSPGGGISKESPWNIMTHLAIGAAFVSWGHPCPRCVWLPLLGRRDDLPFGRRQLHDVTAGRFQLRSPVVTLHVLGGPGDGVRQPPIAHVAAADQVGEDAGPLALVEPEPLGRHLHRLHRVRLNLLFSGGLVLFDALGEPGRVEHGGGGVLHLEEEGPV